MNAGTYSELSSTPEGVKEVNDDLKSQDNQNINDKDIEDMLMNVKADRGFLGDCGVFYKVGLGDAYLCFDKQTNLVNRCVRNFWFKNSHVHVCCPGPDYCDEFKKHTNVYDFGPAFY